MVANLTISISQAQSRHYRRAIEDEMAGWEGIGEKELSSRGIDHPLLLAYRTRILAGSYEYHEYGDWARFLVTQYGPRRRCLSLGSGLARVERFLLKAAFTDAFETIELNPNSNRAASRADEKIRAQEGDLNFVHLPENAYDFILCHGVLHHLINLEHILDEVNHALKPTGLLLIYEYVGETRWQFSRERMQLIEDAFPDRKFSIPPRWSVGGFESVRSADLLPLIRHQFADYREREVLFGGAYVPFVTCSPDLDVDMEQVVALDERLSTSHRPMPCYLMGLYRKSEHAQGPAKPWSDTEIADRLSPSLPLHARARRLVKRSPAGPYLRAVKRMARSIMARHDADHSPCGW